MGEENWWNIFWEGDPDRREEVDKKIGWGRREVCEDKRSGRASGARRGELELPWLGVRGGGS